VAEAEFAGSGADVVRVSEAIPGAEAGADVFGEGSVRTCAVGLAGGGGQREAGGDGGAEVRGAVRAPGEGLAAEGALPAGSDGYFCVVDEPVFAAVGRGDEAVVADAEGLVGALGNGFGRLGPGGGARKGRRAGGRSQAVRRARCAADSARTEQRGEVKP
jgi:hypothetical protein